MNYTYDNADRRTSVTYPNTNKLEYVYNAASELTSLTIKKGTTVLGNLTYTYDAAGNRIKTSGTFARTNLPPALTTVNYNANNQQTMFGTNTLTYDLNGNLITVTDPSGTATYTWNVRNQLTGITAPGFAASFSYDSFGRRTGRTVQGTTTNFVYDGLTPVQEKNGSTVTANLITGLGIDEFLTRTDTLGTRALLTDALGSTIALGDNTGTLQTQYTYEPFGYTTESGSASTSSYKYTGREDDGSGLYYYRARYYHPRLQRFISEDPIGFAGGDTNLYGYVGNSPVDESDPLGLYGLPGAAGAAGFSFLTQFSGNLIQTNFNVKQSFRCVNWTDVTISAIFGAIGPSFWAQIIRGQPGPYGISRGGNAAMYFGTVLPLSITTKLAAPDLRLGTDCECRGLGLGNLAGKFIQF